MTWNQLLQTPCLDVITHGINRLHPFEPRIGEEFTIEGMTFACKKTIPTEESPSSCADCDMPGHLCPCMQCCINQRTDHYDVTFIKLS